MNKNIIVAKSKAFAKQIERLSRFLSAEKHEPIFSEQILRSGTSIETNVREAVNSQNSSDCIEKMRAALKAAAETDYCLTMLLTRGIINRFQYSILHKECAEIVRVIDRIINSAKTDNP